MLLSSGCRACCRARHGSTKGGFLRLRAEERWQSYVSEWFLPVLKICGIIVVASLRRASLASKTAERELEVVVLGQGANCEGFGFSAFHLVFIARTVTGDR
jgi:hypothetical protein